MQSITRFTSKYGTNKSSTATVSFVQKEYLYSRIYDLRTIAKIRTIRYEKAETYLNLIRDE